MNRLRTLAITTALGLDGCGRVATGDVDESESSDEGDPEPDFDCERDDAHASVTIVGYGPELGFPPTDGWIACGVTSIAEQASGWIIDLSCDDPEFDSLTLVFEAAPKPNSAPVGVGEAMEIQLRGEGGVDWGYEEVALRGTDDSGIRLLAMRAVGGAEAHSGTETLSYAATSPVEVSRSQAPCSSTAENPATEVRWALRFATLEDAVWVTPGASTAEVGTPARFAVWGRYEDNPIPDIISITIAVIPD